MQVECSVDEADIGKIKEGQKVKFTVDAFPNDAFTGKVTQVRYSPEVIQNVVTYTTIVEVDNPEMKLRPGMTAIVSVVTGEAKDALRVPNAALRFNPQLSPEEMRKIYEEMRQEMMARRGSTAPSGETDARRSSPRQPGQRPPAGRQSSMGRDSGMHGASMQQFSRIWIEDEKGKLRPIFLKAGVTDNTYTEIIRGDLKEGQLVITGAIESSRVRFRGGMPFMRRR